MKTLFQAKETLAKLGGFTYHLSQGDLTGQPFYVVAIGKSTERVFDKLPTHAQIANYVHDNSELLANQSYAFGGWKNERGQYVLDVVELISTNKVGAYPELLQKLEARQQEAAFDLSTGTEIRLPHTGKIPDSVGITL